MSCRIGGKCLSTTLEILPAVTPCLKATYWPRPQKRRTAPRQGRSVFSVGWVEWSEPHQEFSIIGGARSARPTLQLCPISITDWPWAPRAAGCVTLHISLRLARSQRRRRSHDRRRCHVSSRRRPITGWGGSCTAAPRRKQGWQCNCRPNRAGDPQRQLTASRAPSCRAWRQGTCGCARGSGR
jgi:hypothetical protein